MIKILIIYPFMALLGLAFFGQARVKVAFAFTLIAFAIEMLAGFLLMNLGFVNKDTIIPAMLVFGPIELVCMFPFGVFFSYLVNTPKPLKETPAYTTYTASVQGAKKAKDHYDTLTPAQKEALKLAAKKAVDLAAKHGAEYLRAKGHTKTASFMDDVRQAKL